MIYRVTFKGADGLPHSAEVVAENDATAIEECGRFYRGVEWVLRRRRAQSVEIIGESCPEEGCA